MDSFTWCGVPIPDIHAWARERGEKMVRYRIHRTIFTLTGPRTTKTVEESEAPESFYDNCLYGYEPLVLAKHYEEVERYEP